MSKADRKSNQSHRSHLQNQAKSSEGISVKQKDSDAASSTKSAAAKSKTGEDAAVEFLKKLNESPLKVQTGEEQIEVTNFQDDVIPAVKKQPSNEKVIEQNRPMPILTNKLTVKPLG